MAKNLVIVESPSKSRTIEKYLGKDFKVVSSKGHIRDLATTGKYGLGVDIENDFKPNYIAVEGKTKLINDLKKEVKNHDKIFLATDPDREGEAISWHLKDTLDIKDNDYERVLFHEITKDKVIEAFNHTRKIDDDLVHSQEARRILDRIIGFRLSKLMQSKTGGKSAGRVQSVALKLIVDREREIEAFVPEEYWTITAIFDEFEAKLFNYDHKDIEIHSEEEANDVLSKLSKHFMIDSIETKQKNKKAKAPYITSTLQQDAVNKLNMPSKKTMSVAQKLYEGVDLENETVGLITYMRTDSIRLSDEFIASGYNFIEKEYGKEYVGYAKITKKKENVQDAHEAIRPTSILRTPEKVKKYLSSDEYKLYSMIYYRALASIMADAKVNATTVILDNNNYQFKATGQVLIFDGYLKVYKDYENSEDKILPALEQYKDGGLDSNEITKEQHFTQPPARYTEAKLIKEMEELGIGRPSTYAKIIDTIKEREYVILDDKKFKPTEIGYETTDKLQEFFSGIINVEYTAKMEKDLDDISDASKDEIELLHSFYDEFEPLIQKAFKEMDKKGPESTGETCPECGSDLVIRKGKYGEFVACGNYPECKYIKKEEKTVKEICTCPKCKGTIIERKSKTGKIFYGCNNFPKCKVATWDLPTGELCPECKSLMVDNKGTIKCSNCNFEK
ncbi:MAG: type I DNA topoisomerase [Firmicutes bacterium]|nr:type I DNA topoisomerase [Bacillota bacterium]